MEVHEHRAPLQALLLWQSLALFWFCGLFAACYPLMGLSLSALFLCIDSRLWRIPALCAALVIFLAGVLAIASTMPKRPASSDVATWTEGSNGSPLNVRLEGTVHFVQSLPDSRLRIFLKDVNVVDAPTEKKLPGLVAWTWEQGKDRKARSGLPNLWTEHARPLAGEMVRITAKIRSTEGSVNPYTSDIGSYWQRQGVFWRIWTRGERGNPEIFGTATHSAKVRDGVRKKLNTALFAAQPLVDNSQALAFIPALLMYERFFLHQGTLEKMQGASLLHSLALSGQHLTFIVYYAIFIIFCVRFICPQVFLYMPSNKLIGLLSLPLALIYLWLGNAPISLVRATLMLFIGIFLFFRLRVATAAHVLLFASLYITIYDPVSFYNVGLQLSVLCVGSICLVLPLLQYINKVWHKKDAICLPWYTRLLRHLGKRTVQLFVLSLSIQVVLLPIFLTYFSPSGLWFISNILWLPILGFWVLPLGALGLMCALLSATPLATYFFVWASWPCELLLRWLQWMQDQHLLTFSALLRPHFTNALAWLALCLALAMLVWRTSLQDIYKGRVKRTPAISRLCVLGACLLFIAPVLRYVSYAQDTLDVSLMDVGQGQALYVRLPGGHNLLLDGGGSNSPRFDPGTDLILPSMVYNTPPRLWAMLNTHTDVDHLRGLLHMLPRIDVQNFYYNGGILSGKNQELWNAYVEQNPHAHKQMLYAGMQIALPTFTSHFTSHNAHYVLEILSPERHIVYNNQNNASLIIRLVEVQGTTRKGIFLLCGDANNEVLENIVNINKDISAQILILPHHGSKDALLPALYTDVKPDLALVSTGLQNAYGHPHWSVRNALKNLNIPLYNTAQLGAIHIRFNRKNGSFIVSTSKKAQN